MPTLTRLQIRNRVRKHTNTNSGNNTGGYSDSDINSLIDEAIYEIANATMSRTHSTFSSDSITTVASTRLYSVPSTCLKIFELYHDGERFNFSTIDELPAGGTASQYWAYYGKPSVWYLENSKIGLWPIPDTANYGKTVNLFFAKKPVTLSDDASIPDIHEALHPGISYHVARTIWLEREKPDNAQFWGARYADVVNQFLSLGPEKQYDGQFLDDPEGV